jgi:hypothetical protein
MSSPQVDASLVATKLRDESHTPDAPTIPPSLLIRNHARVEFPSIEEKREQLMTPATATATATKKKK